MYITILHFMNLLSYKIIENVEMLIQNGDQYTSKNVKMRKEFTVQRQLWNVPFADVILSFNYLLTPFYKLFLSLYKNSCNFLFCNTSSFNYITISIYIYKLFRIMKSLNKHLSNVLFYLSLINTIINYTKSRITKQTHNESGFQE